MAHVKPYELSWALSGATAHTAAIMDPSASLGNFRSNVNTAGAGYKNPEYNSYLLSALASDQVTGILVSTAGAQYFANADVPNTGSFEIELFGYTGFATANSAFEGVTRGIHSTTATAHDSGTPVLAAELVNFFDHVSGGEGIAGDTEYRCFSLVNNSADTIYNVVFYIADAGGNGDMTISFAVEVHLSDDVAGAAQTIANESTAPTFNGAANEGATHVSDWSVATTKETGVGVNQGTHNAHLGPGAQAFIWIERVIGEAATPASNVGYAMGVAYDTDAA